MPGPAGPVGLQIYWNLSLRDGAAREEAAVALVGELRDAQRAWEEGGKDKGAAASRSMLLGASGDEALLADCAPALRYSLSRLVRGVASSRESVRQGFAAALAAVAGSLACVDGGAILRVVDKNLEVTTSMKGKDARDILLGRLFAYGALIRGCRGRNLAPDVAKELTQQLLSLASQKSFLREPSVSLLIEFAEPLSPKVLKTGVFDAPLFQEWIQVQPDKSSPDALLLALKLHSKLPESMRESCALLRGSNDLRKIFSVDRLSLLVPVLKESSSCHPRMHSIWPVLLRILLEGDPAEVGSRKRRKKHAHDSGEGLDTRLKVFWQVVVEGALVPSSHERKHLAMDLLVFVLPKLGPSSVEIVLSESFVRCLADILAGEENLLYKSAQKCLQELRNWAQLDDQRTIAVVTSLQRSTHGKFDTSTKLQTVKDLISRLTGEVSCRSLIDRLLALFLENSTGADRGTPNLLSSGSNSGKAEDDSDEELPNQDQTSAIPDKAWVLDQLCLIFKVVQLQPAARALLQKKVLCFLGLHGLFQSGAHPKGVTTELGEKLEWPQYHITDRVRNTCLARLSSLLVDAQKSVTAFQQSKPPEDISADQQTHDYGAFVIGFLGRVRKLGTVSTVHPVSEDEDRAIADLHAAVEKITEAMGAGDKKCAEKLRAMRSFFIQLLLQLYVNPGSVHEIVAELLLFCQHVFGQLFETPLVAVKPIDDETPNSMDVLVDVLLSVLTHPSARLRTAAEHVFRAFCGDLTAEGLRSLLRVVRKQSTSMRHKHTFGLESAESDDDDGISLDDDSEESSDMEAEAENGKEEDEGEISEDEVQVKGEADEDGGASDQEPEEKDERVRPTRDLKAESNGMGRVADNDDNGQDEELSDMDDEQMFKMDVHLSKILQQRKDGSEASKDVQNQLTELKLRCLSLLEIYLQKNSASPLVLGVLPSLLQQLSISSTPEGNAQVAGRLANILQDKIVRGKDYPKGSEVSLSSVKELLEKTLRLAARSTSQLVRKVAQQTVLWLLKVLQGVCSVDNLKGDSDVRRLLSGSLQYFFQNKKCRLRVSFFSEMLTRYPWVGEYMVSTLLEQGRSARNEFLQCQALQLMSLFLKTKGGKPQPSTAGGLGEFLEPQLRALGEAILAVFQKPPEKSSKRGEALGYCMLCLEGLPQVYPNLSLVDVVDVPVLLAAVKVLELPQKKLNKRLKSLEGRLVAVVESIQGRRQDSGLGKSSVSKKSKRKAVDRKDPSSVELEEREQGAGRSPEQGVKKTQKKSKKSKS